MPAVEKRIDPEDGLSYTFKELSAYYKGKYKKKAIEAYWEESCQAKAKAKAKVKAKEKAKAKAKVKAKAKAEKALKPKDGQEVVDSLICADWIVPVDSDVIHKDHAVAVKDGKIVEVKDLECVVCLELCHECIGCHKCRQIMCKRHVQRFISDSCPMCRDTPFRFQENIDMQRLISQTRQAMGIPTPPLSPRDPQPVETNASERPSASGQSAEPPEPGQAPRAQAQDVPIRGAAELLTTRACGVRPFSRAENQSMELLLSDLRSSLASMIQTPGPLL